MNLFSTFQALRFGNTTLFSHLIISVPQHEFQRVPNEYLPRLQSIGWTHEIHVVPSFNMVQQQITQSQAQMPVSQQYNQQSAPIPVTHQPLHVTQTMASQPAMPLPVGMHAQMQSGFMSPNVPRLVYVHTINELIKQLALVIPRIISADQTIWPKPGELISSDKSLMHYTVKQKLAEGSYGFVHLCEDFFKQIFILKIQKTSRTKEIVERDWEKERDFMQEVEHPNIIRLYDAFVYNNLYYYVLERADGSLRNLLEENHKKNTPFDLDTFMDFAAQLLSALCHIHKKNIIHRDLQVDNILYKIESGKRILKITDFGISKRADDHFAAVGSTGRGWEVAPELVTSGKTTFQSDIFQLGLVFYHIYMGVPIVTSSENGMDNKSIIYHGIPFQKAQQIRNPIGGVISTMLAMDPRVRYRNPYDVWSALLHAHRQMSSQPPPSYTEAYSSTLTSA